MKKWLRNLFSAPREETPQASMDGVERLSMQRELQSLRIELDGRDEKILQLHQEIERLRARQAALVEETVTARLEALINDLSGPASQILTQAELLENQGKPVEARDVLSVARRVVRAIERHGAVFTGKIGGQEPFDPNRHTPISAVANLKPGQPVTIRFVGVMYQGKMIYKAMVE